MKTSINSVFTKRQYTKKRLVESFGLYHLIHEYIYRNQQRDVDRTLKISSVEGFGSNLGRNLCLRLIDSKMRLQRSIQERMKFVASDIWSSLFGKSVDKLETDNEGTYIMTVQNLPLLSKISSSDTKAVQDYMSYFVIFF